MNFELARNLARQLVKKELLTRPQAEESLRTYRDQLNAGQNTPDYLGLLEGRGLLTSSQVAGVRQQVASAAGNGSAASAAEPDATGEQTPKSAPTKEARTTPEPAPELPGYEMGAMLGSGSMGRVYRARQLSMDRDVAIKFLPAHLAKNREFAKRFVKEARTVARLGHLNIVTGIDVGVHEGNYYFVMEFLDGETVGDVLRRGEAIDERRAADIVRQIADALEHARQNALVHRDVKPDNILMTADGIPKLGDLGLAFEHGTDGGGKIVGTPQYLAPEAIRRQPVDTRADIYSLGATLLHMLTGKPPFEGNAKEVLQQHLSPGLPDLRTAVPGVSPRLATLYAGMISQDPEHRYQTPAEVSEAASVFLDQPNRAMPRPAGMPATSRRSPVRQGGKGGALGVVAGLAAVAVLAFVALQVFGGGPDEDNEPVVAQQDDDGGEPVAARDPDRDPKPKPDADDGGKPQTDAFQEELEAQAARAFEEARIYGETSPDDLEGFLRRLRAVSERFPSTGYAEKALAEVERVRNEREAEAAGELAQREKAAARHREDGKLGDALFELSSFPPSLRDTESGKKAMAAAAALKSEIEREVGREIAAAKELASGESPAFGEALEKLAALRKRVDRDSALAIDRAVTDIRGEQDAWRRRAEAARVKEASAAQDAFNVATELVAKQLASLNVSGAELTLRPLGLNPAITGDPRLKAALEEEVTHVAAFGAALEKLREGVREREGDRVLVGGERATIEVDGDELLAKIDGEEQPLDLRRLDPEVSTEIAEAFLEGEDDADRLLGASHLLIITRAFDAAEAVLPRAVEAGAGGDRLSRLIALLEAGRANAREDDAALLWARGQAEIEDEKWKAAVKLIEQLIADFGDTNLYLDNELDIQDALLLAQNDGEAPTYLEQILKGKIEKIKTKRGSPVVLEIEYDFEDVAQFEDFQEQGFQMPGLPGGFGGGGEGGEEAAFEVKDGVLVGGGRKQLVWKPQVMGDMQVQFEAKLEAPTNVGMTVFQRDNRSYAFWLGLSMGDMRGARRLLGGGNNMLLKLDPDALADVDGPPWQAWAQSIKKQSTKPQLAAGKRTLFQLLVKSEQLMLAVNKRDKLDTKDRDLRKGALTWFSLDGQIELDELTLVVTLDPEWLEEARNEYLEKRRKEWEAKRKGKSAEEPEKEAEDSEDTADEDAPEDGIEKKPGEVVGFGRPIGAR